MRVLAIDPGYDRLGLAVMEHAGSNGVLLHSECIETLRTSAFSERLDRIGARVTAIIKEYEPDAVALERLFFTNNQRTAMKVAEVRGAMVYLARLHACTLYEYTPQEVKVAVTGYGKSDKRQVALMVKRLVPTAREGARDDEYDAIAIGLTCLACVRQN